jgi:hypothetical protein
MHVNSIASANPTDFIPSDAPRMISRWADLGRPAIELEPGVIISNLERWLFNNPTATGAHLGRIREYLYVDTFGIAVRAA